MDQPIIKVEALSKSFQVGDQQVPVLKDISFTVQPNDFLIIFGPSGCGKSTLLHAILGLEEPSSGRVWFIGKNIYTNMDEDDRADFRKQHAGMVYQQPNWIRSLTVVENIAFPLLLLGQDKQDNLKKAYKMLETVEMLKWADYIPTELSSGQQQRIALARALITNPEVIVADEPTGNLDYESGQDLMQLLTRLNSTHQTTIIMVTHDLEYLDFAKTAIKIFDGKVTAIYGPEDKKRLMKEIKSKRAI